jgi:transaldolase
MSAQNEIAKIMYDIAQEDFGGVTGNAEADVKESHDWKKLTDLGTQLWLDTGDIEQAAELWNSEFSALTTNNTLLNKEVQKGIYDDFVKTSVKRVRDAAGDIDDDTLVLETAFALNAKHALKLVGKFDANVSVELHTDLANDIERSVWYGKRYYDICPERFYVKVPLTPEGFLAARRLAKEGVPINFTLGFSARQNYLAAQLTNPKFVNVFMGRLNSFVADNSLGSGENVGEKTTLATQRYVNELCDAGLSGSKLIGASMRSREQVISLAGLDVFTMPVKVAKGYSEEPAESVENQVGNDPAVPLNDGVKLEDFNGGSLWEVSDEFKKAVGGLMEKDVDSMNGTDLQDYFEGAGFGDFLPKWSDADIGRVRKDGKIPVFETWRDKLSSGAVGLDALMNVSALYSFVTDQEALDGRMRSML